MAASSPTAVPSYPTLLKGRRLKAMTAAWHSLSLSVGTLPHGTPSLVEFIGVPGRFSCSSKPPLRGALAPHTTLHYAVLHHTGFSPWRLKRPLTGAGFACGGGSWGSSTACMRPRLRSPIIVRARDCERSELPKRLAAEAGAGLHPDIEPAGGASRCK